MNKKEIREGIIYLARDDPEKALIRATDLIEEDPYEAWRWSLRSYIYQKMKKYDFALADIDKAIGLEYNEPSSHFYRAQYLFSKNEIHSTIISLSDAIEIGKEKNFSYYDSACLFFRAFCYCKINNFDEAQKDLSKVDDGMQIWIDRLRTKEELLEACKNRYFD